MHCERLVHAWSRGCWSVLESGESGLHLDHRVGERIQLRRHALHPAHDSTDTRQPGTHQVQANQPARSRHGHQRGMVLRTLRPGCPASTASSPPPPASSPLSTPPSAAPMPSSAQPPPPHSPSAATASGSALPVFSLPPAPSWAVPRPRQALRGLAWAGLWQRTGGLRVWFGRRSRRPWRRSAARSAAAPAASRGSPRQALPR